MPPIIEAVIDAGSSGTRIFLFHVMPGEYPVIKIIKEYEYFLTPSGEKEDGLNNYVIPNNKALLSKACEEIIKPLLDSVRQDVLNLKSSPGNTIINLFGTAGMRYAENLYGSEIVDDLYGHINGYIASAGFIPGEIRTCNGANEEGLWSWINLNDVHRDIFKSNGEPLGIIELGGSSAQISYPTDEPPKKTNSVFNVNINRKQFNVFSKTYLGLGQDDMRKKMRLRLGPTTSAVCFPAGFPSTSDTGDMLDGHGYLSLSANGSYKFEACHNHYDLMISEINAQDELPNLPAVNCDFVGIDAIFHGLKFWNLQDDPSQLLDCINRECQDYKNYPDIHENEYAQAQTANATFIHALLYGPNGLIKDHPKKLLKALPNSQNNNRMLTWTRGFLMTKYSSR